MANSNDRGVAHRPRILVVVAGGTFGMHETSRGLAPDPAFPSALERMLESATADAALTALGKIATHTVFMKPAIDSSDADTGTALELATIVRDAANSLPGFRGAVIIHGTDTLAYIAARLAFELHDLACPVLLTGSQFPYTAAESDAGPNLLLALRAAASHPATYASAPPVRIAFGDAIIPAVRATKASSTSLDAFQASLPLAPEPQGVPRLSYSQVLSRARVITYPITPGLIADDLLAAVGGKPDGLILETYGSGNAPVSRNGVREALERIAEKIPVVAISQCRIGGVHLGRYETGTALAETGVIDGSDLTREAALAKLSFLLDRGVTHSAGSMGIEAYMQQNFIGESSASIIT